MNIQVPQKQIEAFCRRWKIREFALFGSVLRDDFRPGALFGRGVDLVRKDLVVNPIRRRRMLANRRNAVCGLRSGGR